MGPKRIENKNFPLFIVKFKKLGFSAPLKPNFSYTKVEFCQNKMGKNQE